MGDKLQTLVKRLIRPEIRALSAYVVQNPEGLIKLDAMENPYALPDHVREKLSEHLVRAELNRYPDGAARRLKRRLRQSMVIPERMELLLGNGSDELIQILLMAVARPGGTILAPTPTFVMYEMIAAAVGLKFVGVPLKEGFALNMPAMLAAIESYRPEVIFLAYPNNPTGNLFDAADIASLITSANGIVVMDEAYHVFAQATFMNRLPEFDNLLVMRTLSKLGLAGLRLGVLIGRKEWITEFDKLRLPYNIGSLTQLSAEFLLSDPTFLLEQGDKVRVGREAMLQALSAMNGIQPWPSQANFILFRTPPGRADAVYGALMDAGILIKNLHGVGGMLTDCLRVTIGAPDENTAFLTALKKAV